MKSTLLLLLSLISIYGCTLNQPPYTINDDGSYVYRDSGISEEPVETMLLPGVMSKSGEEVKLLLTKFVPPNYPEDLKAKGIEGEVDIQFEITDKGAVKKLQITDSRPKDIFDYAVTSVVKRWRFKAGKYSGPYIMTISFEL